MKLTIPQEELMTKGHTGCQGCGAMLAMRYALKALGPNTMLVIPACCWIVAIGPFPYSALNVPVFASAFACAASTAAGVKAGLEIQGKHDISVAAWAGDGGTFDIGLQSLSAAAERNDDIFYFCYDNEAYMNTGRQRSSATPYGAWTMTTPKESLKGEYKKDIDAIMAAHKIPYMATLSISEPEDFVRKVRKGMEIKGMKFFHILSPCPSGWLSNPEDSVKIARCAVETNIFPLYEVENGERYIINKKPKAKKPVSDYLKLQGRYKYLNEAGIKTIQDAADKNWLSLLHK